MAEPTEWYVFNNDQFEPIGDLDEYLARQDKQDLAARIQKTLEELSSSQSSSPSVKEG